MALVYLDAEGFMQEVERFTKQQIPVQLTDGDGPEAGERAEPIAMGRQVLWGGKGRPPSREVMNAAAKAARSEMMQRIRENKDKQGGQSAKRNGEGRGGEGRSGNGQQARNGNGGGQSQRGPKQPSQRNGNGNGARPPQQQAREPRRERAHDDDGDERMPRNIDPLRTNLPGRRDMTGVKRINSNGQPDPTRTSIDSMGATGRRNNGNRGRSGNPARNYGR